MSSPRVQSNAQQKYAWTVGILTVIPGLGVTFSSNHSAMFTAAVFGIWAIVSGGLLAWNAGRATGNIRVNTLLRVVWVGTAVFGIAALGFIGTGVAANDQLVTYTLGAWATVFGLALILAWFTDRTASGATDTRFTGVTAAALGIALLLMPVNIVVSCGLFGAWAAVNGVWNIIAGFGSGNVTQEQL